MCRPTYLHVSQEIHVKVIYITNEHLSLNLMSDLISPLPGLDRKRPALERIWVRMLQQLYNTVLRLVSL